MARTRARGRRLLLAVVLAFAVVALHHASPCAAAASSALPASSISAAPADAPLLPRLPGQRHRQAPHSALPPAPALSPDIMPVLPSPGEDGAAAPPSDAEPTIPSSPSPPNPDALEPNSAMAPFGYAPAVAAQSPAPPPARLAAVAWALPVAALWRVGEKHQPWSVVLNSAPSGAAATGAEQAGVQEKLAVGWSDGIGRPFRRQASAFTKKRRQEKSDVELARSMRRFARLLRSRLAAGGRRQGIKEFLALVAHRGSDPLGFSPCSPHSQGPITIHKASNAAGAEQQPPANHRETDALRQWMRLRTPRLLATKLRQISSAPGSPATLTARVYYSQHAPAADAHRLLDETARRRAGTIVRALAASSSAGDTNAVSSLHCASLKSGAVLDPPVRTSLLTAYARARDAGAAWALFGEATVAASDVIMWNAAIGALTLCRRYDDAAALFRRMARELGEFDSTTVLVMLSGASRVGNLRHGMALHCIAAKRCLDADHLSLWNALVDMYAKCGDFYSSEVVFQSMPCRDTTSWNSVMGGSIFNGLAEVSAWYFKEMTRSILQPDQLALIWMIFSPLGTANSLMTFYSEFGLPEAAEKPPGRFSCRNRRSGGDYADLDGSGHSSNRQIWLGSDPPLRTYMASRWTHLAARLPPLDPPTVVESAGRTSSSGA
nr:unnamed protein product [Digitaria exilis]